MRKFHYYREAIGNIIASYIEKVILFPILVRLEIVQNSKNLFYALVFVSLYRRPIRFFHACYMRKFVRAPSVLRHCYIHHSRFFKFYTNTNF